MAKRSGSPVNLTFTTVPQKANSCLSCSSGLCQHHVSQKLCSEQQLQACLLLSDHRCEVTDENGAVDGLGVLGEVYSGI